MPDLTPFTRTTARTRTPRITQIVGMTSNTTGKPILAALDDQGRVWVADPSTPACPCWQQVEPIQADEVIKEPVATAHQDQHRELAPCVPPMPWRGGEVMNHG